MTDTPMSTITAPSADRRNMDIFEDAIESQEDKMNFEEHIE